MAQPLKRSSSLAETVANTEDLITEILVRLPARTLAQFKGVSKHWLSLISDPSFCHLHTLRNPRSPISAFFLHGRFISEYCIIPRALDHGSNCGKQTLDEFPRSDPPICNPLNFVHDLDEVEIVQSCNGLLLCRHPYSRIVLYVLNPTTNKYSTLAPPAAAAATSYSDTRLFGYALAFDPSKSAHYKVVCLWFAKKHIRGLLRPCHNIEIYSSETRSWKLLDSSFDTQPQVFYDNSAVYCNGAVHWIGQDCQMSYYHIDEERVGFVDKFNISERSNFHTRVVPTYFRESHGGGRLHLIDIRSKIQVLEMGEDYSGWFFKYNVRINIDSPACPRFLLQNHPVVILSLAPEVNEEDEESSCLLLLHTPGKVISYNLRNNTFKSTDIRDDSLPFCRFNSKSHRYVENYLAVV